MKISPSELRELLAAHQKDYQLATLQDRRIAEDLTQQMAGLRRELELSKTVNAELMEKAKSVRCIPVSLLQSVSDTFPDKGGLATYEGLLQWIADNMPELLKDKARMDWLQACLEAGQKPSAKFWKEGRTARGLIDEAVREEDALINGAGPMAFGKRENNQ